ncbi:MAG: LysR family transcriptional regulator [Pseudomonadota bacterium]
MKIDELDIDTRLLHLFLTIYDEGSVTGAANRLGVGQPTVSHGLERLRRIMHDPLFVRAGRGITPTAHARQMAGPVRVVLQDIRNLARVDVFDPDNPAHAFRCVIGANDFESAVILPHLFQRIQSCAADIRLKIHPVRGGGHMMEALRGGQLDLVLGLDVAQDAADLTRQALFRERLVCFYDASQHDVPPDTLERYCALPHARVNFGEDDSSVIDDELAKIQRDRRTVLQVATFDNVPRLIRGTRVITTLPSGLRHNVMAGFATCACPVPLPDFGFYQTWHVRNATAAPHQWLRGEVFRIVRRLSA